MGPGGPGACGGTGRRAAGGPRGQFGAWEAAYEQHTLTLQRQAGWGLT